MSYSPFFHTLHDEKEPYGSIGRGVHYSVLSAPQWFDHERKLMDGGKARIQRFAILWDEDHDTRVIDVAEKAYMLGIFAPVLFIGERKAFLNVVVSEEFYEHIQKDWASYNMAWGDLCSDVFGDCWTFESIVPLSHAAESGLIASSDEVVTTYLANIRNLWGLGIRPYSSKLDTYTPDGWIPPIPAAFTQK